MTDQQIQYDAFTCTNNYVRSIIKLFSLKIRNQIVFKNSTDIYKILQHSELLKTANLNVNKIRNKIKYDFSNYGNGCTTGVRVKVTLVGDVRGRKVGR